MAEVIKFLESDQRYVAACGSCGCTEFSLIIDDVGGLEWTTIKGTECTDCGEVIEWIKVTREDDQDN